MPFILAIDYDETLFEGSFDTDGAPITDVIEKAKEFKENGAEVILWTCRDGGKLQEAIEKCHYYGLDFDAVNDNVPSQIPWIQKQLKENRNIFATRKVYADIYVDDKSPGSIDFFLKMDAKSACDKLRSR